MTGRCDRCGGTFDTHDGGGKCVRCGKIICPECEALVAWTSGLVVLCRECFETGMRSLLEAVFGVDPVFKQGSGGPHTRMNAAARPGGAFRSLSPAGAGRDEKENTMPASKRTWQEAFETEVSVPVEVLYRVDFGRPAPPCSNPSAPAFSDPGDPMEVEILKVLVHHEGTVIPIPPDVLDEDAMKQLEREAEQDAEQRWSEEPGRMRDDERD